MSRGSTRDGSDSPLRVVQFLPSVESASGGPVRSTLANCRAAHRADPEMQTLWISTRHGLDDAWEQELRASLPPRMSLKLFPQVGNHTANVSPRLVRWMWDNLADHHLLVLRALMHPLTSAAGWVARRKGVPYLVVPHGTLSVWTFRHRRRLLKQVYFRFVERNTLEGAAAVRFTSEAERREARRLNLTKAGTVIPHPFESRDERGPSRRERYQVLFLSRLDPKKKIDILLDALCLLRERRQEVRLVLAGSGPKSFEEAIWSMIVDRGLEGLVQTPGWVTGEEKEALLCQSSVFVLASEEENFGVAVVEAMDAALPVVISKGVDIWPQVEDAGAGIVLEQITGRCLAEALENVLNDERLRREMGERGRELVRTAFDPDSVGERLAELYRKVAGLVLDLSPVAGRGG